MKNRRRLTSSSVCQLLLVATAWLLSARSALATDYFITLGGGPSREENQASLEANVLFFKQIIKDKHPEPLRHDIFFAHDDDPAADVQVMAEKAKESELPATELLSSVYRRRPKQQEVTYRHHHVTEIAGALDPQLIREDLAKLAKTATSHDRLIIYVTAHGNPGPKDDPFNTSIDCWDSKKITAREFSGWLDKLSPDVPVVMVMAQCYCGGFGRLIFPDLDESKGFTTRPRVGFFAQQHDLPAAGCRPDIEHDEEFSSYFWGAIAGRRRSGANIGNCDLDGDGVVSFAEAFVYAVTADDTIDIPLRTSEVFLRKYSRLNDSESDSGDEGDHAHPNEKEKPAETADSKSAKHDSARSTPELATMSGSLQSFVDRGDRISARIVSKLAKTLGFKLEDDVSAVRSAYEDQQRDGSRRGRGGRGGRGSGRRDLLKDIAEKWPELGDERHWQDSSLLKADNQKDLLAQIKELPSWKAYDDRLKMIAKAREEAQRRELRSAKVRRLILELETINLAANLPRVAKPEIVERYRQIIALEATSLAPSARGH
jgi:hypothetical protein